MVMAYSFWFPTPIRIVELNIWNMTMTFLITGKKSVFIMLDEGSKSGKIQICWINTLPMFTSVGANIEEWTSFFQKWVLRLHLSKAAAVYTKPAQHHPDFAIERKRPYPHRVYQISDRQSSWSVKHRVTLRTKCQCSFSFVDVWSLAISDTSCWLSRRW
jgi:hypothetical protein